MCHFVRIRYAIPIYSGPLRPLGGILYRFSMDSYCVEQAYTCDDNAITNVTISIGTEFASSPVMIYMGLSGFYSGYLSLKSSFSSTQLQATPRSTAYMPYSGCTPTTKLSDLPNMTDPYIPINAFATDPNWQDNFNMTLVPTLTLRPCGGLFYWIPTDTFTLTASDESPVEIATDDISWDGLEIPSEPVDQTFPYIDNVTNEFVWADPSTSRFRAWMRGNVDPTFVIKVGEVTGGMAAGNYTVDIGACRSLDCSKFVRMCTTSWVGIYQVFLASIYFAMGSVAIVSMAVFVIAKKPRRRTH